MKKILVILGHPDKETFGGALAEAYSRGATSVGAEVSMLRLSELQFDPILHRGYKEIQELEPDLVHAQELIQWAEHVVWVYPIWWGTMPALLKGFLDRVFLPGFAFKYRKNSSLWDKLLAGRSARMIVTLDAPVWYNYLMYGNAGQKSMKRAVLKFSGFSPVKVTSIGSTKSLNPEQINGWLEKSEKLGKELN